MAKLHHAFEKEKPGNKKSNLLDKEDKKENDDSVAPETYSDLDSDECPDADQIVCPQNSSQTNTNVQTRLNISTFARTCDRYGISDRRCV